MVVFTPMKPSKTTNVYSANKDIHLVKFPSDRKLCIKDTLGEYFRRTQPFRGDGDTKLTELFLSHVKPHHPVVSSTIARWLKSVMTTAIPQFSWHTRHEEPRLQRQHELVCQQNSFFNQLTGPLGGHIYKVLQAGSHSTGICINGVGVGTTLMYTA